MPGAPIFQTEVTNVSKHGFWLLLGGEEMFLSFANFPWFKTATIEQLCAIEQPSTNHLYCPLLDVDLAVQSIRDPAAFPLVSVAKGG